VSTVSRYVIYLRVSTDQQADAGQGLDIQEQACRAWIREGRHRLVEVCTDAGRSGSLDVGHRPGLAQALALVGADRADGVLVYRLDRLARDLVLQEQLLAELHRRGKELASVDATEHASLAHSPDDPTRALVRRMLGSIAQYEREVIRLRLMAGRARKKLEGGYAGGQPPYGWAAVRGELVKVPAEQDTIKLMLRLRAQGRSYRQIAAALEAREIRAKGTTGKWRPGTILDIIARETAKKSPPKNVATPSAELVGVSA
jgi:DNA invertase Pin-like site-specific DNA recombinase